MPDQNTIDENQAEATDAFYETFLSSKLSQGDIVYYRNDEPAQVNHNVWLRVWTGAAPYGVLDEAFRSKKPVRVTIGLPHNSPDGKKSSTVQTAEILIYP